MNMNDRFFSFPTTIRRDPGSEKPTRLIDRELLLAELREYVWPLSRLTAKQTSDDRPELPAFDPTESMYIQWIDSNKHRAVYGAAGLFPKAIRVVSADEANLIQFSRHPECDTFVHAARGAGLVVLDLITTLRPDLAKWYNQAAFGSLAGAAIRSGSAIWILGTETPTQFRQEFSDVYRVLRRLGTQEPCAGDSSDESRDFNTGGSYDDA